MMQTIPRNAILRVRTIHFMDGVEHEPISDVFAWVTDNFIIVANDINDTAPSWYNVATVASMEAVEVVQSRRSNEMRLFTY